MPWYSWLEAEGRGTLRMTSCCPHLCVSAEELNAILLAHLSDRVAATLAEERLGGLDRTITDVWTVITVPPWWGSCERAALRDAAVIGGIGGTLPGDIELVDSHAALAFKYVHEWSLRRSDEELAAAQHRAHSLTALLIDIGSTAVTASIVTLASSSGEAARALKPESVSVQAVAWEPTVGGSSFDELIASILRDRYAAQLTAGSDGAGSNTDSSRIEDLLAGARATATLLREGKRVKEVLSASTTAYVTLEGLPLLLPTTDSEDQTDSAGRAAMVDGVLRTNVSRVEFEKAAEGLVVKSVAPVETVLRQWMAEQKRTGTKQRQILQSVQLVGGGSRVPMLQAAVSQILQRVHRSDPASQNHQEPVLTLGAELNADEAMAHGAALLAVAKQSPLALSGRNLRPPSNLRSSPPPSDAPTCGAMEAAALGESRQTVQRLRSGAAAVAEAGAAMYELEAFILAELELAGSDGNGEGDVAAWRVMLLAEEEWVWDNGNSTAVDLRARLSALKAKAPATRQQQFRAAIELAAMRERELETGGKRRQTAQPANKLSATEQRQVPKEAEGRPGTLGQRRQTQQEARPARTPMSKKEKQKHSREKERMRKQQDEQARERAEHVQQQTRTKQQAQQKQTQYDRQPQQPPPTPSPKKAQPEERLDSRNRDTGSTQPGVARSAPRPPASNLKSASSPVPPAPPTPPPLRSRPTPPPVAPAPMLSPPPIPTHQQDNRATTQKGRYDQAANPEMSQNQRFERFQAYQKKRNEELHRNRNHHQQQQQQQRQGEQFLQRRGAGAKQMPVHPRLRKVSRTCHTHAFTMR